jgi:heat shock protein HslJ
MKEGASIPPGWVKDEVREAIRSLEKDLTQRTRKFEDGTGLAVYEAQSQELAGTTWEVTAFNNGKQAVVGVLEGTALTASYGKDGTMSGNSGCNEFNGAYKIDGDQITIGPLASTMKMCSDPAGVMDQEAQYLAALQSAANYQIEGNVLQLRTKDDALAAMFNRK